VDQDAVDMVFHGMQQNHTALAAGVIHGRVTLLQHGWCFQRDIICRRGDYFKANLAGGHTCSQPAGGADICTVTPEWGTKLGATLVNGMVRNAYWTTARRLPRGLD
jgi:hypothetical protein